MNFQKFQLKWNILKHFTRPKQQAALRKLFSHPPDKSFLPLGSKNFLAEKYRHLQTFAFQVLRECSSLSSTKGTMQMLFLKSARNMFAGKFVKLVSFLAVFCGNILFIMFSELWFVKRIFFEGNLILKWMIFFDSFCWLSDFLLKNLKLRDKLQIWGFELFFGPNFVFWGIVSGRFSQRNFCRRSTMVATIFIQPYTYTHTHTRTFSKNVNKEATCFFKKKVIFVFTVVFCLMIHNI